MSSSSFSNGIKPKECTQLAKILEWSTQAQADEYWQGAHKILLLNATGSSLSMLVTDCM